MNGIGSQEGGNAQWKALPRSTDTFDNVITSSFSGKIPRQQSTGISHIPHLHHLRKTQPTDRRRSDASVSSRFTVRSGQHSRARRQTSNQSGGKCMTLTQEGQQWFEQVLNFCLPDCLTNCRQNIIMFDKDGIT